LGDAGERTLVRAALAKLPQAAIAPEGVHSEQIVQLSASRLVWKIEMETKP
jgi:hypothetical protein